MVKTDIGRHIASRSWFHKLCVFLTLLVTAKTAESGARICVMAALKPKESHVSGTHAYSALDSQGVRVAFSIGLTY